MSGLKEKYLPEFVYGAIDGSVTTFAVVAGSFGASLSSTIILILGFANLIGDGFSMAASNYLSTKSQRDLSKVKGKNPSSTALATFFSFIVIGFIPLLSFVLASLHITSSQYQFQLSFVLTVLALLIVGSIKGIVTKKRPIRSSLETLLIGGVAALLAYLVGAFIKSLVG